jgi:hypothetical protein
MLVSTWAIHVASLLAVACSGCIGIQFLPFSLSLWTLAGLAATFCPTI